MMVKQRIRPRPWQLAVAAVLVVGLLIGGWLWLRDSSLVAVERVRVAGVSGPDAPQITSALTAAARNMTTLDVNVGQLRTVVAPYPVVKGLQVSTQFPHGMRILVLEQLPIAALVAGGHVVAVNREGQLMRDVAATSLPAIPVQALPGGPRVADAGSLDALAVLTTAPRRLLPKISQVSNVATHGLTAEFHDGLEIYFGDSTDLPAKWVAATAVLADPGSAGAAYVDVTDPTRPAAGVGANAVTAAGLEPTTTTTSTTTQSTPTASTTQTTPTTQGTPGAP